MFSYFAFRWLLIILLGLVVYAQTFRYEFVFDDHLFIVTNPYIQDFASLSTIFKSFPLTRLVGMYSFALNFALGRLDPLGYHIFNFIVHLIATGMVWLTAGAVFGIARRISARNEGSYPINSIPVSFPRKRESTFDWISAKVYPLNRFPLSRERQGEGTGMTKRQDSIYEMGSNKLYRNLPFIIALLFLVHPCQTQAVTYITQRYESMATVLYLSSFYSYLRARIQPSGFRQVLWFAVSVVAALLGIMTKETALTIPVMILAAEWILIGPFKNTINSSVNPAKSKANFNRAWPYILTLCAGVAFCLLFMKLVHNGLSVFLATIPSSSHDGDVFTFPTYVLTQARVFMTFLRLLVFPVGQNLDYDFAMSTGIFSPPSTALCVAATVFLIFIVLRFRRPMPLLSFSLAWMLVTFSVNLVPRQNAIFEHKIYLISFGFFIFLGEFLTIVLKDRKKVFLVLAIGIVVMTTLSYNRNQVWKNELMLWEDIYQKSPNKSRVNANLGRVYGNQKRYEQAMFHLGRAIELKPDDPISHLNRGLLYHELGRDELAMADLNEAIRIDPEQLTLWTSRASVHMDQGRDEAALDDLNAAIRLKPFHPQAYLLRGTLFMRQGRHDRALEDLSVVLKISPNETGALINRGAIYYQSGRYDLALEDFRRAHRVSPGVLTFKNLALSLIALGRRDEAFENIKQALKIDPDDPEIRKIYEEIQRMTTEVSKR